MSWTRINLKFVLTALILSFAFSAAAADAQKNRRDAAVEQFARIRPSHYDYYYRRTLDAFADDATIIAPTYLNLMQWFGEEIDPLVVARLTRAGQGAEWIEAFTAIYDAETTPVLSMRGHALNQTTKRILEAQAQPHRTALAPLDEALAAFE